MDAGGADNALDTDPAVSPLGLGGPLRALAVPQGSLSPSDYLPTVATGLTADGVLRRQKKVTG